MLRIPPQLDNARIRLSASTTSRVNACIKVRPSATLLGKRVSMFQLCGCTGLFLALVQSIMFVRQVQLSQVILLEMIAIAVLTFLGLAMLTKVISGQEQLIYYHHEIAIMAMLALFLRLTRQPILPYLDIAILGIGTFLICGRVGCLMVGCCHGRPCACGVCYSHEHAANGFPSHFVGVRLFPIQAVESIFVLAIVVCGSTLMLSGSPAGSAVAIYVLIYGIGRFCFEFARGDRDRAYLWGFSEAQWTSLLIACVLVLAERVRPLPGHRWHWLIPALMFASMAALAIAHRFDRTGKHALRHPHHLGEIISALNHLKRSTNLAAPHCTSLSPALVPVEQTSRGYRFSLGEAESEGRSIRHYSVSKKDDSLSITAAHVLARLIAQLEPGSGHCTILPGHAGVFHILFNAPTGSSPD